ncbi:hypothetical protein FRB93_006381 [Tulasnella sp. JGI-2019a]|nr:hypothetical protein FRB93_006381 [Tulasnella sp. JGI-2019a]
MNGIHRALAVPELLVSIFRLSTENDLNSLALVCSSWKDLALDIKWRTLTVPLTVLFKMLAPFCDEELNEFCEPDDDELEISDDDWSAFQHYAQKVTRIKVDTPFYHESVIIIQRRLAITNQEICPNLVVLELEDVEEGFDLDGTLAILAGARLRTVSVAGNTTTDEETIHRLKMLASLSARITNIVVSLQADDFTATPDYTIFQALRQLRIKGTVWRKGWEVISDCPLLTMLEIEEEDWMEKFMIGEDQGGDGRTEFFFPNLELLSVKSPSWSEIDAVHFITTSAMPKLQSLKFTIHQQAVYVQLLQHLRKTSPLLQSLHVETDSFTLNPSVHAGDILKFSAIRKLVLETTFFNDAMLEQIGSSLPELREFHIGIPPMGSYACNTSASTCGLLSLSIFCRSLEHLSISVSDPPDFHGRTSSDLKNRAHSLRRLRFYHLGIADKTSEGFADWVAMLCPRVSCLEVNCLTLGRPPTLDRRSTINKKEIDHFVESVFKAQQLQLLNPISLSTKVHPNVPGTLGNGL